jgi:hypothetical protein
MRIGEVDAAMHSKQICDFVSSILNIIGLFRKISGLGIAFCDHHEYWRNGHESLVTLPCGISRHVVVNGAGESREQMLHDDMARSFGRAVLQTYSHQLCPMPDDGQEKWRHSLRCLVVVQQPGFQELTNSRRPARSFPG